MRGSRALPARNFRIAHQEAATRGPRYRLPDPRAATPSSVLAARRTARFRRCPMGALPSSSSRSAGAIATDDVGGGDPYEPGGTRRGAGGVKGSLVSGSGDKHDYWQLKRNTQVKHDILSTYLLRWGSILSGGDAGTRKLVFHYVDGFAGRGR